MLQLIPADCLFTFTPMQTYELTQQFLLLCWLPGTPSFWDALSIDTVGSLLFAFLQSRDRQVG